MNFKTPFKVLTTAALVGALSLSAVAPGAASAAEKTSQSVKANEAADYTISQYILTKTGAAPIVISADKYQELFVDSVVSGKSFTEILNGYSASSVVTAKGSVFSLEDYTEAFVDATVNDTAKETEALLEGLEKAGKATEKPADLAEAKVDENGQLAEGEKVPSEEADADFEVTEVAAINPTGVEVSFTALKADKEDANVEVIDNKGNKVATVATLVAEGATSAEFQFEKPFASDYKFEGVWKVNGQDYNFDVINQLADILAAAEANNEIKFQAALDAAGVTYADEAKVAAYLKAVVDADKTPEKIADVQALINKVDEEKTVEAEKTAAAKAVASAKTQAALLKALQDNFKLVNADWIVTYVADVKALNLDAETVTDADFATIQTAIDNANIKEITKAAQVAPFDTPVNTDLKAKTAAEQKVVTTLIEKWHDEDDAEVKSDTVKAEALKASKLAEAKFAITDAKTATALYNALVAYVKVVDDEAVIKADEVKVANKQGYWNVLEAANARTSLLAAIQEGSDDIKASIITAGDANAETAAETAALDKLNKVTTTTTNAQVVEYLKAVQALTENSTEVVDTNAAAYKEAVVAALAPVVTPPATEPATVPLTKNTAEALVLSVNNTEEAKAFAEEHKAILTKATLEAKDLKAAVAADAAYNKLDTDVQTAYDDLVSASSGALKATAAQLTAAQAAFYTAYDALTKEADVVKAIDELDNKFFAKLTDAQKLEVAAFVTEDATVTDFSTLTKSVTAQTSFYKEVLNEINGAEKLADLQDVIFDGTDVTKIGEALGATDTNYKLVADSIFSGKPAGGYTTIAEATK